MQHLPALQRYARSLTGDEAEAEALAQACLQIAVLDAQPPSPGMRVDSWLFRHLQALWTDARRVAAASDPAAAAVQDPRSGDGPPAAAAELNAAQAAFAELSQEDQSLAALVILQGASYEAAALSLGVSRAALVSRVAQLRTRLAARLDPA